MLIDQLNVLSDAQEVKASAASENIIDQKAKGDAFAAPWLVARVDTAFAGGTAYKIALETANDSSFTGAKVLFEMAVDPDDMVADAVLFKARLPEGTLRYIRGYYTVTGTGTAGKISLFLTDNPEIGK